jgi:hypothetical protein
MLKAVSSWLTFLLRFGRFDSGYLRQAALLRNASIRCPQLDMLKILVRAGALEFLEQSQLGRYWILGAGNDFKVFPAVPPT